MRGACDDAGIGDISARREEYYFRMTCLVVRPPFCFSLTIEGIHDGTRFHYLRYFGLSGSATTRQLAAIRVFHYDATRADATPDDAAFPPQAPMAMSLVLRHIFAKSSPLSQLDYAVERAHAGHLRFRRMLPRRGKFPRVRPGLRHGMLRRRFHHAIAV